MTNSVLFCNGKRRLPLWVMAPVAAVVLATSCMPTTSFGAAPEVPADISGIYYRLGGGSFLPPPGAMNPSFNIRSRLKMGIGYSCGSFNFQNNLSQMVNQFQTKARQLPGQLAMAAQAALISLPGYFLQKKNPTLYNIITKTLDETATLFNASFKSCQEIERQMQRSPDANPYQGFVQASTAEIWKSGANNGDLAADVDEKVRQNPTEPIKWIGGALYGTAANPVQINRDIVVAGYNIMLGRTGDVSVTSAPTGTMANAPIVKIWRTPDAAGRWAQEVLGDTKIVLKDKNVKPETIPGKGLRPKVEALEVRIQQALQRALDNDDYADLAEFTSLRISSAITASLREMSVGEAAVMMDRLVSELAVSEARERMMLVKQMMMTGLRAPDLVASTGGSVAEKFIRGSTFPDMDRLIREIFDALELKQRTVNQTTIAILNRAAATRAASAEARPSQVKSGSNALGGAVPK